MFSKGKNVKKNLVPAMNFRPELYVSTKFLIQKTTNKKQRTQSVKGTRPPLSSPSPPIQNAACSQGGNWQGRKVDYDVVQSDACLGYDGRYGM